MDLKVIESEGVDWIHLAQDRAKWWLLVITVINIWVPFDTWDFLAELETVRFPKKILLHRFIYS
jgi:hypothetical protein